MDSERTKAGMGVVSGSRNAGEAGGGSRDSKHHLRGLEFAEQEVLLAPGQLGGGFIYRGGSATDQNLTPRSPQDLSGDKRGLSTFANPAHVQRNGFAKAQEIDPARLGDELSAIANGRGDSDSHVSVRPASDELLREWADTRAKGGHRLTMDVRRAIRREVRLEKPAMKSESGREHDKPEPGKPWPGDEGTSGGGGASSSW